MKRSAMNLEMISMPPLVRLSIIAALTGAIALIAGVLVARADEGDTIREQCESEILGHTTSKAERAQELSDIKECVRSRSQAYCHLLKLNTDEAYQSCLEHPELWTYAPDSSPYAEKDYIWDCASYRWKWEDRSFGRRNGYKTLADACVMRPCRWMDNWAMCANGNMGYVPRKLRRIQQRELGRVPHEKYVKANSK